MNKPQRYANVVIPHIMVENASKAIEFYKRAFEATEVFRVAYPDKRILHAEITIAGSLLMIGDAETPFKDPLAQKGTSVGLHVYVDDVDSLFKKAVRAGAKALQPPQDMFYGARSAMIEDPFGHVWVFLQQHKDIDPEAIRTIGESLLQEAAGKTGS